MRDNRFTAPIELRFRDIDAMGHVNNAVYFTFFEYGRWRFFYSEAQKERFPGMSFILAHVSCDFVKPVTLEALLNLRMWVATVGTSSFGLHYRLEDRVEPSIVYATGQSVQVFFDYLENRPKPIPESLKAALMHYRAE